MGSKRRTSWKDMTPEQKKQYFLDYYLVRTLIGAALILFAVVCIRDVLKPKPDYALQIGIYDVSLSDEEKKDLVYRVQKTLNTAQPVSVDDAYSSLSNDDLLRIATFSTAGKLDLIIADREVFEWLAGYGYFKDLSKSLEPDSYGKWQDSIVVCKGLAMTESGLLEADAEGNGEPYAAGIRVQNSGLLKYLKELKDPVAGIILESEKGKEAVKLLEME